MQLSVIEALLNSLPEQAGSWAVRDVRIGLFQTIVVVDTPRGVRGGLASTLAGGQHQHGEGQGVRDAGRLTDYDPLSLAALGRSDSAMEAAVGLAAMNALIDVDEARCVEVNAADILAERGAGKRVAIVGHFPFVPQLCQKIGMLDVLELNPREGDLPADQAARVLPEADVVAITGTTLLNHTFDALVALCSPEAYVVMLGGTTPLSPVLFDYGVDAVAGTQLVDVEAALRAVGEGASFRQVPGRRLLTLFR